MQGLFNVWNHYLPTWTNRVLSATGRRKPTLMLRQSLQRQSMSCPCWTALRYWTREIPLLQVRCCHLSQPSHCKPSCRALTGSLHQMHRSSCVDIFKIYDTAFRGLSFVWQRRWSVEMNVCVIFTSHFINAVRLIRGMNSCVGTINASHLFKFQLWFCLTCFCLIQIVGHAYSRKIIFGWWLMHIS